MIALLTSAAELAATGNELPVLPLILGGAAVIILGIVGIVVARRGKSAADDDTPDDSDAL